MVDGLELMELLKRADVTFTRVHRTKHAYVVRTFDYQQKLSKVLEYLSSIGIVSVGQSRTQIINMDEAIRRGLSAVKQLEAEVLTMER